MDANSKKLRELEEKVLELPKDEDIDLYVKDDAEMALHEKARDIKEQYRPEAERILKNQTLTFEQITDQSQAYLDKIPEHDKFIINESHKFMKYRLMRLIFKFFRDAPSLDDMEVWQRVTWFFEEMDNLKTAKAIEDSEWNFNRNEDDPAFDDYKWWDDLDKKIREYYPKGVFTQESYDAVRDYFDEVESRAIRAYWEAHPEEQKEYMAKLEKRIAELHKEHPEYVEKKNEEVIKNE